MYEELETGAIIAFLLNLNTVLCMNSPQEGTGQKAHFSLEDTPGSFTVHANKMLAKVASKPDSIKVIVKPGMAEFPVPEPAKVPTEKPLVHVVSPAIVRPVGGWNFVNFGKRKRSRVVNEVRLRKQSPNKNGLEGHSNVKKSFGRSERQGDKANGKEQNFGRDLHKRVITKLHLKTPKAKPQRKIAQSEYKKMDSNYVVKRFAQDVGIHDRLNVQSKSVKSKQVIKGDDFVKLILKRDSAEPKMQVQGGTGELSVLADKKMSKVLASSGGVHIFMKNPSPSQVSRLPQEMLKLPGAMVEIPKGTSQVYSGLSQFIAPVSLYTPGVSQPPVKKPWVPVRLPHDSTGVSNWDNDN